MNHRQLGKTGIEVSEIAFGAVELGLPYGIGVNNAEDMLSELDAQHLLQSALEKGINTFDTAPAYGRSEELLGKAFEGKREKVVICTKCRMFYDDNGRLPTAGKLKEIMDDGLHDSLKNLRTDYIDVLQLHQCDREILNRQEVLDSLLSYKKQGLVRATGASTYGCELSKAVMESDQFDVIQFALNLMDQRNAELFNLAGSTGTGVIVRSVLFKGILTDKGRGLHPELRAVEHHREIYNELLSEDVKSLSALAVKFVLSFPEVSTALLGIDKSEYLEQAVKYAEGEYLDSKTMKKLRQLSYPDPDALDLVKWYQKGWLT